MKNYNDYEISTIREGIIETLICIALIAFIYFLATWVLGKVDESHELRCPAPQEFQHKVG